MHGSHTGLQTTNEMPLDRLRQQLRLLAQLLRIILAKVRLFGGLLVQCQNVIHRLELGHGHKPDLLLRGQPHVHPLRGRQTGDRLMGRKTHRSALGNSGYALADFLQLRDKSLSSYGVHLHLCITHSCRLIASRPRFLILAILQFRVHRIFRSRSLSMIGYAFGGTC